MTTSGLLDLAGESFVLLTTFRASGEPVSTPLWVGRDGDALVVLTPSASGKVKRLRGDRRVLVQPCGRFGAVTDSVPAVPATAEIRGGAGGRRPGPTGSARGVPRRVADGARDRAAGRATARTRRDTQVGAAPDMSRGAGAAGTAAAGSTKHAYESSSAGPARSASAVRNRHGTSPPHEEPRSGGQRRPDISLARRRAVRLGLDRTAVGGTARSSAACSTAAGSVPAHGSVQVPRGQSVSRSGEDQTSVIIRT